MSVLSEKLVELREFALSRSFTSRRSRQFLAVLRLQRVLTDPTGSVYKPNVNNFLLTPITAAETLKFSRPFKNILKLRLFKHKHSSDLRGLYRNNNPLIATT